MKNLFIISFVFSNMVLYNQAYGQQQNQNQVNQVNEEYIPQVYTLPKFPFGDESLVNEENFPIIKKTTWETVQETNYHIQEPETPQRSLASEKTSEITTERATDISAVPENVEGQPTRAPSSQSGWKKLEPWPYNPED